MNDAVNVAAVAVMANVADFHLKFCSKLLMVLSSATARWSRKGCR